MTVIRLPIHRERPELQLSIFPFPPHAFVAIGILHIVNLQQTVSQRNLKKHTSQAHKNIPDGHVI